MNANEIERALGADPGIAPSPDFGARVMRAVRGEVRGREGIAFPWRRLRYGLGASLAVAWGAVW